MLKFVNLVFEFFSFFFQVTQILIKKAAPFISLIIGLFFTVNRVFLYRQKKILLDSHKITVLANLDQFLLRQRADSVTISVPEKGNGEWFPGLDTPENLLITVIIIAVVVIIGVLYFSSSGGSNGGSLKPTPGSGGPGSGGPGDKGPSGSGATPQTIEEEIFKVKAPIVETKYFNDKGGLDDNWFTARSAIHDPAMVSVWSWKPFVHRKLNFSYNINGSNWEKTLPKLNAIFDKIIQESPRDSQGITYGGVEISVTWCYNDIPASFKTSTLKNFNNVFQWDSSNMVEEVYHLVKTKKVVGYDFANDYIRAFRNKK